MIKLIKLFILMFIISCGSNDVRINKRVEDNDTKTKVLALQDQINSLLESDFKTCSGLGETSDLIVKNICKIAQAATNETRVELIGILGQVVSDLQKQINSTSSDLSSVYSQIETLNSQLSSLLAVSSAGFFVAEVGSELVSAGPVRESVLMKQDRSIVNAYVESRSTTMSIPNNGVTAVNASSTVTVTKSTSTVTVSVASPAVVTWTANPWSNKDPVMFSSTGALPTGLSVNTVYYVKNKTVNTFELSLTPGGASINTTGTQSGTHSGSLGVVAGDLIALSDIAAGRGFTIGDMTKEYRVATATTASLTLVLNRNATSSGTFGSSWGTMVKINGRGMSTAWQLANGSDLAVRTTSLSTRLYNFIIKVDASKGYLCYDTTDGNATFATINAANTFPGLTGNIRCK